MGRAVVWILLICQEVLDKLLWIFSGAWLILQQQTIRLFCWFETRFGTRTFRRNFYQSAIGIGSAALAKDCALRVLIVFELIKALRETQTLPIFFAPPQTPFPEARDGQNLISWRWSLPLPIDPSVWWGSMHEISIYRGNRPTNTQAHKHKQTEPITIHCAAIASAQCNETYTI